MLTKSLQRYVEMETGKKMPLMKQEAGNHFHPILISLNLLFGNPNSIPAENGFSTTTKTNTYSLKEFVFFKILVFY
jgi:hypothetical protein